MSTKYYVDLTGRYIGGFVNSDDRPHPRVPNGSVEVPTAPEDSRQVWNGTLWGAPPTVDNIRSFTPLQFIERFTVAEQNAITTAALTNAGLNLWLLKCMGATEVLPSDPRTIAGMDALVTAGLLTSERRNAILGVS